MKTILNRIGAIRVTPARFFGFWAILFALVFSLCSCSDDLDVQPLYSLSAHAPMTSMCSSHILSQWM